MFHSLRTKISLIIALTLFLGVTAYLYVGINSRESIYYEKTENEILAFAKSGVERVNYRTNILEKKARELENVGEVFYKTAIKVASSTDLRSELESYLLDSLKHSPVTIGGGIRFDPHVFNGQTNNYSLSAYHTGENYVISDKFFPFAQDYLTSELYAHSLPSNWSRTGTQKDNFYWIYQYPHSETNQEGSIIVGAFMHSEAKGTIGISFVEWSTVDLLSVVENSKFSTDSHVLLLNKDSGQMIVSTFKEGHIPVTISEASWVSQLTAPDREIVKDTEVLIGGIEYAAYYGLTDSEMLFVMLVPAKVISGPVQTMNTTDVIAAYTFGFLVVLLLYITLFRFTRSINILNNAVTRVAGGDMSVEVNINSKDEFELLATGFNQMTRTLAQQKSKLEIRNCELEERTRDIEYEKNKILLVTENMKGGALLLDSNGEVIFVNEKLYKLLGMKQADVPYTSMLDAVYKYFEDTDIKDFFKKCNEGKTFTVPEIEGRGRIFEISFINLDAEDEKRQGGQFVLMYDITDIKSLERSKSKLVAVASHQLRTPLTAMRGNVEMLIDKSFGPLNPEQLEMLSEINVSTTRLISMVNEMLDITKIEKGDLNLVFEQVNVKEVIDSIYSDLSEYAEQRGVTLSVELPEDLSIYVDKSRARQVLQNLIDNAIKYSKNPGMLYISSSVSGNFAQIIVKDNGAGIPKNEQSRIFSRFYRASNTVNSQSSGSGLGLFIVRSIVGKLGGDIWFESEENIGTTFFVTFPVNKIKAEDI